MQKIKFWIKRYLPAEIAGTVTAIISGLLGSYVFTNGVIVAFLASWGENIGYYGIVIVSDIKKSVKEHKTNQIKYGLRSFSKDIRNLIVEFGPAELLDSFIVRPFTIFMATRITGSLVMGIIVGKIAADIIFYFPTIIMYEFRERFLK